MEQDLFSGTSQEIRKAIVIGASSGMGKELAKILASENYMVGITGRRQELLEEIRATDPERFVIRSFDVTDLSKTTRNLESLIREMGGLDLLVMSAGVGFLNEELDASPELETIATNVTAFTDIMTFGFNYFLRKKKGHLVAITSIAALSGSPVAPSYNASKAYQLSYLQGLRKKAVKSGLPLIVTDIRPGFVRTGMAKGEGMIWVAEPEKAARQIRNAIRRNKKVAYITRRWSLFAMMVRLFPMKF